MFEKRMLYTEKFLRERNKIIAKSRGKDEFGAPEGVYDDKIPTGEGGVVVVGKTAKEPK
ncbi:MAG: hypothetical protein PHY72_02945 [Candidatus Pacebacteria bacterium]|nr:hypothetical protein [Candidatus Paceibacterota bacterium]